MKTQKRTADHPYLAKLGMVERAGHALASALTTKFAWTVIVYAARRSVEVDAAEVCLAGACPDTVSISMKVEPRIPEDEVFVVVRSRVDPLRARAMSFDRDLFNYEPDSAPSSAGGSLLENTLRDLFCRRASGELYAEHMGKVGPTAVLSFPAGS